MIQALTLIPVVSLSVVLALAGIVMLAVTEHEHSVLEERRGATHAAAYGHRQELNLVVTV